MEVPASAYLDLADWRRRMAGLWHEWRSAATEDPAAATKTFRAHKDRLFREHSQSPLPEAERAAFPGLGYWPYDPAWRMELALQPAVGSGDPHAEAAAASPGIELPASGPGSFSFRRIGRVELEGPLEGESLPVFWMEGYSGGIFVPFRDGTSGDTTYAAGRYLLDTAKSADHGADRARGTLTLDFNMAFHPSCAYDARWVCPLAPPEARLGRPVEVGERLVAQASEPRDA
jgi:uncharacterized protein